MGEMVMLVNHTRREFVGSHLEFCKPGEWTFRVVAGAMTTWYMLRHRDDDVRFFGDYQEDKEFGTLVREYRDATETVIASMVEEGILADHGRVFVDETDPENVYLRDIRPRREFFYPPPEELAYWTL